MRLISVVVIAVFLAMISASVYINYYTNEFVRVEVLDKDRECTTDYNSEGNATMSCRYVVYTDSETFVNEDAILHLKFDSSDVQRLLKVNQSYCVEVVGYRIPVVSVYRNIIGFSENC